MALNIQPQIFNQVDGFCHPILALTIFSFFFPL